MGTKLFAASSFLAYNAGPALLRYMVLVDWSSHIKTDCTTVTGGYIDGFKPVNDGFKCVIDRFKLSNE